MKMKKLTALVLTMVMLLSMGSMGGFATEEDDTVFLTTTETSLIQRAEFSRNDTGAFIFTSTSTDSKTRLFADTQLYVQEKMVIQPLTPEAAEEIEATIMALRAGGGSIEKYSNLSGAVVAYLTIYYQYGTAPNGETTVTLTNITGRYTTVSQAMVTDQSLTFGQLGSSPQNIIENQSRTVSKGTSSSWTQSIPSGWVPLYDFFGLIGQYMGANLTVYYNVGGNQSGTSTSLYIQNNY